MCPILEVGLEAPVAGQYCSDIHCSVLRPSLPVSIKDAQDILQHPHARSDCLHVTLDRFCSPVLILPGADTSVAFMALSSSSHMDNKQENNQSCSVHGLSPCQG